MSGLTYGPKSIVDNGLVLHLDPANPISVATSQRVDPIHWVTDMKKSGRVSYATSNVSDTVQDYTPAWENNNGGTMRFETSSINASDDYGYIDLETPVVGIHSFSINDCYTFDFWWKQDTVTNDDSDSYISAGGQIYGPRNRTINDISAYSGYKNRHYRYPMSISISHPHGEENSEIAYSIIFFARDEKYNNLNREHLFEYFLRSPKLDFNTWNHLCGVFDLGDSLGNGKKAYLYLNGELGSVTGVSSITGSDSFSFDQNGNSYIGAASFDYTAYSGLRSSGAKGVMGPFKIYNRALTQTEARQNYNALRGRYNILPVASSTVASGQKVWTSDDTWVVPDGVTSISAVCVGGGGGSSSGSGAYIKGAGGGGGGLSYGNAISVIPRETLTITVGDGGSGGAGISPSGGTGGDSSIFSEAGNKTFLMAEGGSGGIYDGAGGAGGEGNLGDFVDGGGNGGEGGTSTEDWYGCGGGGGGAGGYSGNGGNGGYGLFNPPSDFADLSTGGSGGAGGGGGAHYSSTQDNGGGGVGIVSFTTTGSGGGNNSPGEGGSGGSDGSSINGNGGNYGGGAGGHGGGNDGSVGAGGAVRIIWGDYFTDSRSYPSNSADA